MVTNPIIAVMNRKAMVISGRNRQNVSALRLRVNHIA
jgi:hypothetical protein